MPEKESEYISKAGLKMRGWTEATILHFMPMPDKEARNPHYRSASPMKLYLIKRIEEIENSSEFIEWSKLSEKRKLVSRGVVETKMKKMFEYATNIRVWIKKKDLQTVRKNAIRIYNEFKGSIAFEREDFEFEPA